VNLASSLLVLIGGLLAAIALVQAVSRRASIPEPTLLCLVGIGFSAGYAALSAHAPGRAPSVLLELIDPALPAQVYLWLFLPPLLFQAALSIDVRAMLPDVAPILILAIVAVAASAGMIGLALAVVSGHGVTVGLLAGAMVATTDPAAVVAIFRDVGAPARLIHLVEGESLFNDAAAIVIVTLLLGSITGNARHVPLTVGVGTLLYTFGGGVVCGFLVGRIGAFVLHRLGGFAEAEAIFSLALPYPVYLLSEELLQASGVVSVVCAGLTINALGRTRLTPRNWDHLQLVWTPRAEAGSRARQGRPGSTFPPSTLEYKIKSLKIRKSHFKFGGSPRGNR